MGYSKESELFQHYCALACSLVFKYLLLLYVLELGDALSWCEKLLKWISVLTVLCWLCELWLRDRLLLLVYVGW